MIKAEKHVQHAMYTRETVWHEEEMWPSLQQPDAHATCTSTFYSTPHPTTVQCQPEQTREEPTPYATYQYNAVKLVKLQMQHSMLIC